MYANEQKTKEAFRLVKEHISSLQNQVNQLKKENKKLNMKLSGEGKKKTEQLVAAKTGSTVHKVSCPYAKKIQPKNRHVFKSVTEALNDGYNPCECMKNI
ncbi:MAG: hypothetical protein ACQESF_04920 [Nanobdellota archaeon]